MTLHEHLSALLSEDADRIEPSQALASAIRLRAERRRVAHRTAWRASTVFAAVGVAVIALAVISSTAQPGRQRSLIASAQAAYGDLRLRLEEPGAVRHTVMLFWDGGMETTLEKWSNADATYLLGSLEKPFVLQIGSDGYMARPGDEATDAIVVSGTDEELEMSFGGDLSTDQTIVLSSGTAVTIVATEPEKMPGEYIMTQPPNTATITERVDPEDSSVVCADLTQLTPDQAEARDLMQRVSEVGEAVNDGTSGPEALVGLLTSTSSVEDRGTQTDGVVGNVRVYRISYQSVGTDAEGQKGFAEFGISTETSLLRLTRNGTIDKNGTERVEHTSRVLVDEVVPAQNVPPDLFLPERLGFEQMPPPDANNPDSWPTFELKNGCFRQGPFEPEWLSPADEAAARARIEALGPNAPSMGGGGF